MNKRIIRFLATMLSVVCLAPFVFQPLKVMADENLNTTAKEEADKVREIVSTIATLRANAMLEKNLDDTVVASTNGLSAIYTQIEALEKELFSFGVQEYTTDELLAEFEGQVSPYAYLPPSTSSVKWYMYGYDYVYEGVPYRVRLLYAQGLSSASNLAGGADSRPMYSSKKEETLSNISTLASIYAQKIIGQIPVVTWTPYELLFSNYGTISDFQHYVTYRYVITVCFSYVYPLSEGESAEQMTFVSSSVAVSCAHTFAGYLDGTPIARNVGDQNYTINATNYASKEWSCKAYKYPSTYSSSFVSNFSIYNMDNTRMVVQNLATPNAWSLIY
ncbi:MAG: hypothetical protein J6J18_05040 [Oscillospiraceae bacterium]|nr:hypothetical protein [Oscillospiraceae bacterium]